MGNNNSRNPALDILGFLDQALDAIVDKELLAACEKTGDATASSVIGLCMEYGLHGRKLMEFIQKLGMICDLTKGKKEEGEED